MSATISGNVGGASYTGADVQLINARAGTVQHYAADGSGNYTFTVAAAGLYQVRVAPITVSSVLYNYLTPHSVPVAPSDITGATTFGNVNLNPTASTSANNPPVPNF
jgi:hypothetical protein